MKKIFIVVCVSTVSLFACKQEFPTSTEVINANVANEHVYSNVELPEPNTSYLNYINNSEENDEQKKFDIALYYLSKALKEVCNDLNLISTVKSSFFNSSVLKYDELMKNTDIKLMVENSLLNENLTYDKLLLDLKLDDITYYPTIELSNSTSESMKIAELPIICAGVPYEYYTSTDTLGGYIMAWKLKSEGSTEVLINEDKKNIISSPVFIVTGSTDYIAKVEIGNSMMLKKLIVQQTPGLLGLWKTQYSGFKIDYRYESDKYSNYRYTGVVQSVNGIHNQDIKGGLICNVHKNDIGKSIVPRWGSLQLDNSINSATDIYIESYYVTYEYDWYSSYKNVEMQNTQNGTINFRCRMNKPEEYYQIVRTVRNTHKSHSGKGFINVYNPCCF